MTAQGLTTDRFLGGRIVALQPERGFRAGHDTVLLAAAVPAKAGDEVLELGAGVGIASLCLAVRVPQVRIRGVEIDPDLVALANRNAKLNGMAARVQFVAGDVRDLVWDRNFDHVFFNPPFHPASGRQSADTGRDRAMRDSECTIGLWTRAALGAAKPGGTVTAVLRADRADEMLKAAGRRGAILLPLLPHAGEAPKRIVVRLTKDGKCHGHTVQGLVLHGPDGKPTPEAEAVLRHAGTLALD